MAQYGIRVSTMSNEDDMSWPEFSRLLIGITFETPLGEIVKVRAEENKETLKNFTAEQHRIRNEWRRKQTEKQLATMTDEDKVKGTLAVQEMFAQMFGAPQQKINSRP